MIRPIDVLIPTYNRPASLAITLTSLFHQTFRDFRVIISDQSPDVEIAQDPAIQAICEALEAHGNQVEIYKNLPARGMAHQRHYLLEKSSAPYVLYLDDDLLLEPWVIELLYKVIQEEGCGFVGNSVIGLKFAGDVRPHEQAVELWEGPVQPEGIVRNGYGWERYKLHNAANLLHVQKKLGATPQRPLRYKVAWVAVVVLYDVARLRQAGGFDFWSELGEVHSGEDVVAQWNVMKRFGGCGVMPSGAYHLMLPTTIPDRTVDAPRVLQRIRQ